jgi:hypothetical protein
LLHRVRVRVRVRVRFRVRVKVRVRVKLRVRVRVRVGKGQELGLGLGGRQKNEFVVRINLTRMGTRLGVREQSQKERQNAKRDGAVKEEQKK